MSYPTFEGEYQPRLRNFLERDVIGSLQTRLEHVRSTNDVDEAERLLDEACDQCLGQVTTEINSIKSDVKRRRQDTNSEQSYITFVQGVTVGIRRTEGLFQQIFGRIRSLITTVVDWIRSGISWVGEQIQETFHAIRNFFG